MSNETPKEAARRFSKSVLDDGFEPVALHEYTDENGKVLYWRIRCKHPVTKEKTIKPMRLGPVSYELKEPKFPNGKPLYGLCRLVANPNQVVWVVEGEQKADELNKLGLIATTSGALLCTQGSTVLSVFIVKKLLGVGRCSPSRINGRILWGNY